MNNILLNDYLTISAIGLLVLVVVTLFWKRNIVFYYYVALLVLFNSSTYGVIVSDSSQRFQTIYARGSGVFPLSIINMTLIAIFSIAVFHRLLHKKEVPSIRIPTQWGAVSPSSGIFQGNQSGIQHYGPVMYGAGSGASSDFSASSIVATPGMNLSFPLIALLVYCMGYLFWENFEGIPSLILLNDKGIINIANFALFACILRLAVNSPQDLRKLTQVIVVAGAFRAVFGLVRMAFWGGDPANFYANVEKSKVALSFFDISQSIVFFFCAAYLFLMWSNFVKHDKGRQWWQVVLSLLFVANIIFSFRRTAWIGLCLGLGWLALQSSRGRGKVVAFVVIGIVMFTVSGWLIGQRFTGSTSQGVKRTATADITNKKGEVTLEQNRYAELNMAVTTWLNNNPLFGMGTAVGIDGKRVSLSSSLQNNMVNTRKLFMHSGLLHVLFKLGLIGFFLFVAILFKYGAGWLAVRRKLQGDSQEYIIGEASFAAFIFTIPDLLNGTPFIVFRVAQMYALMLGITWVASSLAPVRSN